MNVHTEPAHGRAFPPQGGSAGDRACADLPGFRPMVQAKHPAPPAGLSARQSVAGTLVATATAEMASATWRLPPACAPLLRLHTICPYYTMFPLDFPFRCLSKAEPGEWVLDPFCGRGSTNFAARLRALPSVGVDSNPVAAAVAAAKVATAQAEDVVALCRRILSDRKEPENVPSGRF